MMNLLKVVAGVPWALGLKIDKALTPRQKLSCPVISIGNIAVGGRAKTPFVIWLAKFLKKHDYTPVVLSRGYGRTSREPFILSRENLSTVKPENVNDEALEVFWEADCTVALSANRFELAKEFLGEHRTELGLKSQWVFILDDGFQHWALDRDLDVVIYKNEDLSDALLPWGRLREYPEALKRAEITLKLGDELTKTTQIPRLEKIVNLENPENLAVVTTRAENEDYFAQLEKLGLKNFRKLQLPDHSSLEGLSSQLANSEHVLVGAKEAVKIFFKTEELQEFFFEGWGQHKSYPGKTFYLARCVLKFGKAQEVQDKVLNILSKWDRA